MRVNTEGTSGSPSFGQVVGEQGHYPYGEVWYSTGTTTKYRFTSYERDAESGNDYAMYRYHANRLGRFLSTDPVDGLPSNPQSLNRYAYTMNDPVNLTDPNGLCTIEVACSLRPFGCVVYENCGPRIPRPQTPPGGEGRGGGFGFGFSFGVGTQTITCDQPNAKISEDTCAVFSAGSIFRQCGYVHDCALFIFGGTMISKVDIAGACKVPISAVKDCPKPPKEIQIFARTTFFGTIVLSYRINVQSSAFK